VFCFAALVAAASAGGVSRPYRVVELTRGDSDRLAVVLESLQANESCKRLEIRGEYQKARWWWPWGAPTPREQHRAAIELLGKALQAKEPLQFGVMGEGLRYVGTCAAESKGLAIEANPDGQTAVYSFYKWP
jgi:hypothetical protein